MTASVTSVKDGVKKMKVKFISFLFTRTERFKVSTSSWDDIIVKLHYYSLKVLIPQFHVKVTDCALFTHCALLKKPDQGTK